MQSSFYTDKEVFIREVKKMFSNARIYNLPETIYVKAANELEEYINPYLDQLKDDQIKPERSVSGEKTAQKGQGVKKKIKKDK